MGWAYLATSGGIGTCKKAIRDQNVRSWRVLQSDPDGQRHLEKRGNLSRWENPLCRFIGEDWMDREVNTERWQKGEGAFVEAFNLRELSGFD